MLDRRPAPVTVPTSPLVEALAAALREVEEARAAERSERRARMRVIPARATEPEDA